MRSSDCLELFIQQDLADYPVRLRELISGGEPLNPEVIERVQAAWRLIVRDGYGQTESTAIIGNAAGQKIKTGSMGRPLPGYEVELLDDTRKPAQEGETCLNLSARPIGLMLGYVSDGPPAADAPSDGFYHTGDVASRDADGYITFIGRKDDVFKASDYRVSPFELESALPEHPAVAEAAVVPSPHALRLAFSGAAGGVSTRRRSGARSVWLYPATPGSLSACATAGIFRFAKKPFPEGAELRRLEQDRSIAERKPQELFEEDF